MWRVHECVAQPGAAQQAHRRGPDDRSSPRMDGKIEFQPRVARTTRSVSHGPAQLANCRFVLLVKGASRRSAAPGSQDIGAAATIPSTGSRPQAATAHQTVSMLERLAYKISGYAKASTRCSSTAGTTTVPGSGLTLRSTGEPTAGRATVGENCSFRAAGCCSPVSSNVRQHKAAAATSRKAAAAAQYQASTGARLAATRQSNVAVGSQSLTRSQASAFIGGRRERRAVQLLEKPGVGRHAGTTAHISATHPQFRER